MTEPFLGEIRIFAGNFAPKGWAFCDGQVLAIAQNAALFSLLGTQYGGNGQSTFALPDLRGRVPIGQGTSTTGTAYSIGQASGVEGVNLATNETPAHTHSWPVLPGAGTAGQEKGGLTSVALANGYDAYNAAAPDVQLDDNTIAPTPANQTPHENMAPFLALTFIVALQGIFPSRS